MDDFNNFFDDQRSEQPQRTPVYHTPSPKHDNKLSTGSIVCIVMAVVMCVVVLVNVIVLASLKQTIAEEYAASISADMKEQYRQAIDEALSGTNIVNDVTNSATQKALETLNSTVGQVADKQCSASVARLYMYTSSSSQSPDGVASGFLITDTDESGTVQRYMLTNAHCVRYEKETTTSTNPWGGWSNPKKTYTWASYAKIVCYFDSDDTPYEAQIIAYGSYSGENLDPESDNNRDEQADIALLRIKGTQPANDDHPSLEIASPKSVKRGAEVALIGNPEGIGLTNSITTGTISQKDISISSWGAGTFLLTDAPVNSGNSGGPMVDINGVVVGIVESKLVDESIDNMGFALDVDSICSFITWAEKGNNTLGTTLKVNYKVR